MQLPTMNSPAVNSFPIPLTHQYLPSHSTPSNIQSAPLTMQLPTMHDPAVNSFPIPLTHQQLPSHSIPVTSSQHHSSCSSPQYILLQSTVSQFLSPTNISLPIQSPSNIQSAPLTMQLPTMHSPTVNSFPIPLTHPYLPSHSIPR